MSLDWKMTVSRNDLLRELEKVNNKLAKQYSTIQNLQGRVKQLNQEAGRGYKNQNKWITDQIRSIGSMAAGAVTFLGVQRQITAELARQKQINDSIAERRMSLAGREDDVKTNLGKVSTEVAQRFVTDLRGIAKDAQADLGSVYTAASSLLSASGGNQARTKNILAQTAPMFRNRPDALGQFSGAIGDLANFANIDDPQQITRLIGLALSAQQQGRITNIADLNKFVQSAAAGKNVDTSGDSVNAFRTSLALNAAISGMIADEEGAMTKTAAAEFETSLAELLPEKDVFRADGSIKRRGTGLTNTMDRWKRLIASPALQREFVQGSATFEKLSARGPILPVLQALAQNPESEVAKKFMAGFQEITPDEAFAKALQDNLDKVGLGPTTSLANRQKAAEDAAIVSRPLDDLESQVDKAFADAMGAGGHDPGLLGRTWANTEFFLRYRLYGQSRASAAADTLEGLGPVRSMPGDGSEEFDRRILGAQTVQELKAKDEQVSILRSIDQTMSDIKQNTANGAAGAKAQINSQREPK